MKIVRVSRAGGSFELMEQAMREPSRRSVRIRVQACGVCHSDVITKEGILPGLVYPRAPGHEVAGVIDAIGADADPWKAGDRVGVGWHGGHCGKCESCRRGDFITCVKLQIPGISYDGGYSEFVIAPVEALARIPDELTPEEAAPLMCAGVTTFNALRNSGARPGDLVAVQGIGGLGHLGVQFASKFGFETVAIGRGAEKKDLALETGRANLYRRRVAGCHQRTPWPGRCPRHSRYRAGWKGDGRSDRWAGGGRKAGNRRREPGAVRGFVVSIDFDAQVDRGLAIGNFDRLRGHAQVRSGQRRAPDD